MGIALRGINRDNWKESIRLSVGEEQKGFVASNLYSIAESKVDPALIPIAIYHDGTMVGFTMYGRDPADGKYWIIRLMIDQHHQRQGYGKAAMAHVIHLLKQEPDCKDISISYEPHNLVAEKLYQSLGFEKTGEIQGGEVVARLHLSR